MVNLDMSKAYDRVEWLLSLLDEKNRLLERWTSLIMACLNSVSFQIILNGIPSKSFIPTRGIRQEEPLSYFLFVLYSEGFSCLIRKIVAKGTWKGIRICPNALELTHLFFEDDNFLFLQADLDSVGTLQKVLNTYHVASGQRINMTKSSVFYNKGLKKEVKDMVTSRLGVVVVNDSGEYLGLPYLVGRSKEIFSYLKDRARKKTSGWKEQFLSVESKEILVKSVLQAISTYAMSLFLLPKGLCDEITQIVHGFWWGKSGDKKGVA